MGTCSKLIEVLMKKLVAVLLVAIVVTLLALSAIARQGGRGPGIEPLAMDDHTEYQSIFDGKTLNGWDGDPHEWRVEGGVIIGESPAEKPIKVNTFLIWRGGQPKDFDLKVDYPSTQPIAVFSTAALNCPTSASGCSKAIRQTLISRTSIRGSFTKNVGVAFLRCAVR